jgi:hypothetical protein
MISSGPITVFPLTKPLMGRPGLVIGAIDVIGTSSIFAERVYDILPLF